LNPYFGHAVKDHPLMAIDKVRYAGETGGAVVAIDERTAFEALEFIDVKYEDLKGVFTRKRRWLPTAPLLHRKKFEAGALRALRRRSHRRQRAQYMTNPPRLQWGDVDKAFKEAASVVEGNYYFSHDLRVCDGTLRVRCRCHRPKA
jgi:CO/xanthine dehydrogenase Mo-binding subunit